MYKESTILAEASEKKLDLNTPLADEFYYQSLPLCVIDALYSLNQHYNATQNVISRFCKHFEITKFREPKNLLPVTDSQFSIDDFVGIHDHYSFEKLAIEIYKNRRPTSSRNGILRSEAICKFAIALKTNGVSYLQDVEKVIGAKSFEKAILEIPGQSSGISLRYFYMLAGSDDYLKPDIWLIRFVEKIIGRRPTVEQCERFLLGATEILKPQYPHITPRRFDYAIWSRQQERNKHKGR